MTKFYCLIGVLTVVIGCFVGLFIKNKNKQKKVIYEACKGRLTYREAGEILGIHRSTVAKYIRKGKLQKIAPVNGEHYSPDRCILAESVFALKRKMDLEDAMKYPYPL